MNGNILVDQGQEDTFVWSHGPNCPWLLQARYVRDVALTLEANIEHRTH